MPSAKERWAQAKTRASQFYHKYKFRTKDRLVVVDDAERCDNPVFLIGLHRSGTTLTRQIVDSHSNIACPPETFFLLDLAEIAGREKVKQGFWQLGFDEAAALRQLGRGIGQFYEAYRKAKDAGRWADKTPMYGFILPFIDSLFGGGTQYVMIYRHPMDIVASLHRLDWSHFPSYDDDPLTSRAMYVADGLQRQYSFQDVHGGRCFSLFYEEMMADPHTVLRGLFDFLSEEWQPAVLQFNEQEHDYGVGDIGAQVHHGFRPSSGKWRELDAHEIEVAWEHVGDVAQMLGYSLEGDAVNERGGHPVAPVRGAPAA